MEKKYYWLKLKEDFFEEKQIKYLRKLPDGDRLVIAYLKMQLKSLRTEGLIQYDRILPSNEDELAMILDEDANVVKLMLQALMQVKAIEILDDGSFYMIAMQDLIGREGQSAERVRRFREKQKQKEEILKLPKQKEPKTNAERQRNFRAKKKCEDQHIPLIEDFINNKRYNGNYYLVLQRDRYKCSICGSVENLCVHHIDGYNEEKKENSNINKMITLCRYCHSNIHAGKNIDEDILYSIDYYSNEMLPSNTNVTKCNTEIEIEKEIEKDIDIDVDVNNDNAKIVKCYEENIGLLTPASVELIFSYLDVFNADIICEAIKKASVANVRNTKYICGILKDWKNKGIKTLVDIDTEQQKRDAQKNKPVNETEEEKIARKIKELEESCKSGS